MFIFVGRVIGPAKLVLFALALLIAPLKSDAVAEHRYEGVKFHVVRTEHPGTKRLYRLLLPDQSHVYTASKAEADRLVTRGAKIEPMDAFVFIEQAPNTVRLYRIAQKPGEGVVRWFYTSFEPEMRGVIKQPTSRLHHMKCYVFPNDVAVEKLEQKDVIPVFWFYNPDSGEHFYTTLDRERDDLIRVQRLTAIAAKYEKLRGRRPTAVGVLGDAVRVGAIEWNIKSMERLGGTIKSESVIFDDLVAGGQFVEIEFGIENKGKSPATLVAPRLVDADGREFADSIEAVWHIPKENRLALLRILNPGVPGTCRVIYDVPKDARSLSILVSGLDFEESIEGFIELEAD